MNATGRLQAIKRGVFFEICYAQSLDGSRDKFQSLANSDLWMVAVDSIARRHLISNAKQLLRLTRCRNIILSSGARRPMDLRGPADVANL